MLRNGFSLVESIVSIFLIALVFMVITSGLSGVLTSISSIQNMQRLTEFEKFIARWVYIQSDLSIAKDDINKAFYNTTNPLSYPQVKSVTTQAVGTYFDKFTFEIEYLPGRTKFFSVYKYKAY